MTTPAMGNGTWNPSHAVEGAGEGLLPSLIARTRRVFASRLLPLTSCLLLPACGTTHRTLVITSDPPGALVHVNDVQLGETPLEAEFTWFGVYDVRLSKPGYEPLSTSADANANLHDTPPFDFFSEILPGTRTTTVRWHFTLEPARVDQPALIDRARDARDAMDATPGQ